jgi:molybdopterin-guanine dinucleotide biosynthesis protein A
VGEPIGVVLAGGAGSRLGGAKPGALLGGRPLAAWVAAALGEVVGEVAIVAKTATPLPGLGAGVAIWREPAEPMHPLAGIVWAIQSAGGRAVLTCPVDLPFVGPEVLRALLAGPDGLAVAAGQPLLGCFPASALSELEAAVLEGRPARDTIAALAPTVVAVSAEQLFNVNTPGDLATAEARLRAQRR